MKAHEQLKMHDKMQREFINIAAHELRTPIQPILGSSQVVHSKIKDPHIRELQDVIIRNAETTPTYRRYFGCVTTRRSVTTTKQRKVQSKRTNIAYN
jgi:signal transduction histidine kinase